MSKFYEEIEDRINSPRWSKQIAHQVILKKRKRDKKKRGILGSLAIGLVILSTIGVNVIQNVSKSNSWENQLLNIVFEDNNTTVFSQEVDNFIEESFK